MAVRKKGSRRIVVDGVTYLWRFPRRPTVYQEECWGGCCVTVQGVDRGGSVLVIRFAQHQPSVAVACGFPVVPVLPFQVARAIQKAIAMGWKPDEPNSPFGVSGESGIPHGSASTEK